MTVQEQQANAKAFIEYWTNRGDEKSDTQQFWTNLLTSVFGITEPQAFIEFEKRVKLTHTSFIDAYIPSTKVLIEQKGADIDLRKGYKQSDGAVLTPFGQAKRYANEMPYSSRPRWVVVCNFQEFLVYDMENPNGEPYSILLKNLEKEYSRLSFLTDEGNIHLKREMELSIKAGELVGKIYDALLAQYKDATSTETLKSLNVLCVRLVFLLYAEDAGIFGVKNMFYDYMVRFQARDFRRALIDLFQVLDTKKEDRDAYLDADLAQFPYVNGGLFSKNDIEIPQFTDELRQLILDKASEDFDWSEISPTIFGAVFESTLNPETRRSGGMHYTSIENIHKVIDPLFLNDLRDELEDVKAEPIAKTQLKRASEFQNKLASLKFLDPACGSGNFLTESYLSLRRLENEAILLQTKGQMQMGFEETNPIKVNIHQFYGIEINDFAVSTATTALWIAESQMLKETSKIIQFDLDMLPLKAYRNITEGNALQIDWESVVPKSELNYIMGNPPFVGARMMEQGGEQKKEIQSIFGNIKDVQDLDYVTGWYKLAALYIQETEIAVAFVSTNSITQGSQVPILWNVLLNELKIKINFAYQTFKWNSESNEKAAVHCVIIGFSTHDAAKKYLYTSNHHCELVSNISPYLFEGGNNFVVAQKETLCDVPKMNFGNQPRDGGYFILTSEEKDEMIKKEPTIEKYIHQYIGAEEFIKNKKRWCLWLKNISPSEIKNSKIIYERVEKVRQFRLSSSAKTTNGYAKVPHLFAQITQPDDVDYLIVPRVSSEKRRYAPIGFLNSDIISSDAVQIILNATLYHFGILTSFVHMAWMRVVCGRLKSDYRYSKELVYNTFPWPTPTEEQKAKIEQTAQAILDVRAKYPGSSLADLYDEVTMPPELRRAHQDNDRVVMAAYGFSTKMTESECVAELFKLYEELVK